MALADTETIGSIHGNEVSGGITPVATVQFTSKWYEVNEQGHLETQDNASITNPDTQVTGATNRIFRSLHGTLLMFRMKYDDGLSSITDPVIKVFGRFNSGDQWMLLRNQDEAITMTLTTAATDVTDGTDKWTTPDLNAHVIDKAGCREFLVGVQTALAATGDPTLATIEVKEL